MTRSRLVGAAVFAAGAFVLAWWWHDLPLALSVGVAAGVVLLILAEDAWEGRRRRRGSAPSPGESFVWGRMTLFGAAGALLLVVALLARDVVAIAVGAAFAAVAGVWLWRAERRSG